MKKIILGCIWLYQKGISPYMTPRCRYIPTCSQYAVEAIEKHGVWKGGFLAMRRLLRCHPFSHRDPYDPVP